MMVPTNPTARYAGAWRKLVFLLFKYLLARIARLVLLIQTHLRNRCPYQKLCRLEAQPIGCLNVNIDT